MTRDQIVVEPVPGACGARVRGIDLSGDLAASTVAEIRSAFLEHHVLFFPGQALSPERQVAFGKLFGQLEDYPFVAPLEGYPKIIPVIKEGKEGSCKCRCISRNKSIRYS